MQDPAFSPRTCPTFSNASIKEAQRPNMRHRGAALAWRWQKKSLKHTEDGFGSKANPKRERLYVSSYALQNREKRHEGSPQSPYLGSVALAFSPFRMRSMVAGP